MQPSLREDQNRLGRTHLQYSLRRQSQARLFTGVRDLKLQNRGSFFLCPGGPLLPESLPDVENQKALPCCVRSLNCAISGPFDHHHQGPQWQPHLPLPPPRRPGAWPQLPPDL
jgi:hypothetical protein